MPPPLFCHIFVSSMEKGRSTIFRGILTIFLEVMNLQTFEFNIIEIITANIHNIQTQVFLTLWRKNPLQNYGVFDHFSRNYEVTNFE